MTFLSGLTFMPYLLFVTVGVSLVTPIGLLRLAPLVAALGLSIWLYRKKEQDTAVLVGLWVFFLYLADLLAWWFSKRPIEPGTAQLTWGSNSPSAYLGGFPIHVLEIPPPPMGGDLPIVEQYWVVVGNLASWAIVSAVVILLAAWLIRKQRTKKKTAFDRGRVLMWLLIGAFFLNQAMFATFFFWFD